MFTVLCELDAELCEVFACGGQIVSDDGNILLYVHDDRRHIRALVTHVLHTLPRHLRERETDRGRGGPVLKNYSIRLEWKFSSLSVMTGGKKNFTKPPVSMLCHILTASFKGVNTMII